MNVPAPAIIGKTCPCVEVLYARDRALQDQDGLHDFHYLVDKSLCHWQRSSESQILVCECRAHFWVLFQNPCAAAHRMTPNAVSGQALGMISGLR